jgi:hypothetical protein
MQVKPGARLKSQVCDTQIVIVKAPAADVDLRCGGVPVIEAAASPGDGVALAADHSEGTLLGKRYADDELGLEILCSKGGKGSLSIGETRLEVKGTKALPSSD